MRDRGEFESVLFDGEAAEPALLREDVETCSLFEPAESRWDVSAPTIGAPAGESVEPGTPTRSAGPTSRGKPTGRATSTSKDAGRPDAAGMPASSPSSAGAAPPGPLRPPDADPRSRDDRFRLQAADRDRPGQSGHDTGAARPDNRSHQPGASTTSSPQLGTPDAPAAPDRPTGTRLDSTWLPDQQPYPVDRGAQQQPGLEAPGNLPPDARAAKPGSSPLAAVMMIPILLIFWGLGPWPSAVVALMAGATAWNRQNSARVRLVAVVILAVSLYFALRGQ